MNLKSFDNKCVRIITASGEEFEGIASYLSKDYVFHEYGRQQEALLLTPILFYNSEISDITSLENVNGPFGHFSEKYGLLEKKCLEWGTDLMEEVFDSEDDIQILRMLACLNDHHQSLADRAVPGLAPWRSENNIPQPEDDKTEQGPVYLGELEKMLCSLIKCSRNAEVIKEAENLLERLKVSFP